MRSCFGLGVEEKMGVMQKEKHGWTVERNAQKLPIKLSLKNGTTGFIKKNNGTTSNVESTKPTSFMMIKFKP